MTTPRFSAAEIGAGGPGLVSAAQALEAYAAQTPEPADGLIDRIMAALVDVPAPSELTTASVPAPRELTTAGARAPTLTPAAILSTALRRSSFANLVDELAAVTRTALGVGRWVPLAVRAQAIAILLTVALVLVGSGAALAAGAAGVLDAIRRPPAVTAPAALSVPGPVHDTHDPGAGRDKGPHGKSQAEGGGSQGRGGDRPATNRPVDGAGEGTARPGQPGAGSKGDRQKGSNRSRP